MYYERISCFFSWAFACARSLSLDKYKEVSQATLHSAFKVILLGRSGWRYRFAVSKFSSVKSGTGTGAIKKNEREIIAVVFSSGRWPQTPYVLHTSTTDVSFFFSFFLFCPSNSSRFFDAELRRYHGFRCSDVLFLAHKLHGVAKVE